MKIAGVALIGLGLILLLAGSVRDLRKWSGWDDAAMIFGLGSLIVGVGIFGYFI